MDSKRGISPIIATVLLLGFTVALATTVFLWMKGQTETMSESTVEYAEGEMQCQNVRINVAPTGAGDPPTCATLEVSNKGYITINQLAIRTFNPTGAISSLSPLGGPENDFLPPQSTNCGPGTTNPNCGIKTGITTGCNGCTKVEVMPIIQIQTRKVGCKDRRVTVEC